MSNSRSRLVYSTYNDNLCPRCQKRLDKCRCSVTQEEPVSTDGIVLISRETKGRNGKAVTLVKDVDLNIVELKKLSKRLKNLCGSGGTVKHSVIEIQGDHRSLLKMELEGMGFTTKAAN
jgi:translation initiation factor 1